jgi:hypothetical protein
MKAGHSRPSSGKYASAPNMLSFVSAKNTDVALSCLNGLVMASPSFGRRAPAAVEVMPAPHSLVAQRPLPRHHVVVDTFNVKDIDQTVTS